MNFTSHSETLSLSLSLIFSPKYTLFNTLSVGMFELSGQLTLAE